jgi:hypothetical protein
VTTRQKIPLEIASNSGMSSGAAYATFPGLGPLNYGSAFFDFASPHFLHADSLFGSSTSLAPGPAINSIQHLKHTSNSINEPNGYMSEALRIHSMPPPSDPSSRFEIPHDFQLADFQQPRNGGGGLSYMISGISAPITPYGEQKKYPLSVNVIAARTYYRALILPNIAQLRANNDVAQSSFRAAPILQRSSVPNRGQRSG